jgi:thymidylate synthase (FAD)
MNNDEFAFDQRYQCLDHGYVNGVEYWGSDERVIESARMSTNKGFNGWGPKCSECGRNYGNPDSPVPMDKCLCGHAPVNAPGDEKLLRFLWENKHHTPFEMAGLTIEVQAPIFVFREWHRHRVPFSYNEASARYAPLPDLNYVPTVERLMTNSDHHHSCAKWKVSTHACDTPRLCADIMSGANKQAGKVAYAGEYDAVEAERTRTNIQIVYNLAQESYEAALKAGCPKELARVLLPVGRYSKMRASANLRGWCNFMQLRQAPNAQYEIRVYADAVNKILSSIFPRTMRLFNEEVEDKIAASDIVSAIKAKKG